MCSIFPGKSRLGTMELGTPLFPVGLAPLARLLRFRTCSCCSRSPWPSSTPSLAPREAVSEDDGRFVFGEDAEFLGGETVRKKRARKKKKKQNESPKGRNPAFLRFGSERFGSRIGPVTGRTNSQLGELGRRSGEQLSSGQDSPIGKEDDRSRSPKHSDMGNAQQVLSCFFH